jgi:hypothetical protein
MKKIKKELYCPTCKKFVKDFRTSILGDIGYKSGPFGKGGLPFKRCRKCDSELMELSKIKNKRTDF